MSITYLSLMFGLAGFNVRMKAASPSERAAKLATLAALFSVCSIFGGYAFGFYQTVYVILAVYLALSLCVLAVTGLSSVIAGARRRAVSA